MKVIFDLSGLLNVT